MEVSLPSPSGVPAATDISAQTPLPVETDEWEEDAQICDECVLTSQDLGLHDVSGDSLLSLTRVQSGPQAQVAPLAEDNLPYVEDPLIPREHQAFCLEIPIKLKHLKKWAQEINPEQMVTLASVSKRARAEVSLKDLTVEELRMFSEAKQREILCWIQTSAIQKVLRAKLNPAQILKSRWILTWKAAEDAKSSRRAKARLVVLGYQDPKLTEVMGEAPTLSKEGRAIVLQTIASKRFHLESFDIKTAFLLGKADESNPLAMDPPKELRQALGMTDDQVCLLLGNAYGRVDAPLLFYKELSKQLLALGFSRHPLEPCVWMLYTEGKLRWIVGIHVDDGVCGGDAVFRQKIADLQRRLPLGSQKAKSLVFTSIQLEQFPDFTIREFSKGVCHEQGGRHLRMGPLSLGLYSRR